jgi:hypothetical protein
MAWVAVAPVNPAIAGSKGGAGRGRGGPWRGCDLILGGWGGARLTVPGSPRRRGQAERT